MVIHDNKESHIIEQHIMESNQLTSHYLMFKLVKAGDHIQHLNLSFLAREMQRRGESFTLKV